MPSDLILVGHLAQDRQPDGSLRLGGTVTYAGILAAKQGLRVGILTSATQPDLDQLAALIPNLAIVNVPTSTPTIFENTYINGQRHQWLRARAALLTPADLPEDWRTAPMTLLGPIADEVDPALAACLTGPHRAATPQGWLRAWDATGRVHPIPWRQAELVLPNLSALILSVEDLAIATGAQANDATLARWAEQVPLVALTDGPRGATLWVAGSAQHVPAFPVAEVDPTGAGDCFATALLIALHRTGDPLYAARYAHAAAAFVVRAAGTTGIPTPAQITALLPY